jgi:hypothetical protein
MYNYGKETDANIVCANLKFLDLDWNIKDNPHYEEGNYARFDEYGKTSPKDYGIPYAFYKNIYKKEYINEYNLRFPDLLRGQDPIFMANSLINTPEIYTTPFDLYGYNHDIGGGVNKKINTYEKKRDYIQHFKDTSDILAEGGFQETSDFFKIHMFRYLTFEDNNADPDVFELFNEIFGIDNETFDESDFNYVRFIVPAYFYFLKKYDSQEFYLRTNKKFLTMNIYDTFLITEEIVNKYLFVVYSYSYDDFKSNCDKYLSNNLKFKDEFMKFKVEKFLFNLEITFSPVVFENTKMILENNPVFKNKLIYKNSLKKCFMVLSYDTVEEYKENL